jgi:hypothetical protein
VTIKTKVRVKFAKVVQHQPTEGAASPAGAYDSAARLDVQAAMMRNHTWISAGWKTWDNQHAAIPEAFPIVAGEKGESTG